jgi:hypothetical protein
MISPGRNGYSMMGVDSHGQLLNRAPLPDIASRNSCDTVGVNLYCHLLISPARYLGGRFRRVLALMINKTILSIFLELELLESL